jgi:hypothetical protein
MFLTPNLVVGLTIMAVGIVLLLDTLGIRDAASMLKYWPALIVLFGASIVAQAVAPVDPAAPKRKGSGGAPCFFLFLLGVAMFGTVGFNGITATTGAAGAGVSVAGVMGKAENRSVGSDVRYGRVTAVMGRSSLDLRQVTLAPGEEVVVDVFVTMGRATVRIPDHWVVDTSALPVMGSVDEERFTPLPSDGEREKENEVEIDDEKTAQTAEEAPSTEPGAAAPPASGPPPRLRLRGFVMMGKVEVTS